jgi:8-oxo-dGTP diphosphatase
VRRFFKLIAAAHLVLVNDEGQVLLTIGPEHVEFAHVMHDASGGGRAQFFFLVRQWTGTPVNCEPGKCSELAWFALDRLPEPIVAYCREALARIAAGEHFSVYGW